MFLDIVGGRALNDVAEARIAGIEPLALRGSSLRDSIV